MATEGLVTGSWLVSGVDMHGMSQEISFLPFNRNSRPLVHLSIVDPALSIHSRRTPFVASRSPRYVARTAID